MADITPNTVQATFGFLSGPTSIHFPRRPAFTVGTTVDQSQNAKPVIEGGTGLVTKTSSILLPSQFLLTETWMVNLLKYKAAETKINCYPGVAPIRGNHNGIFKGFPFYDSWQAVQGANVWPTGFVEVDLFLPLSNGYDTTKNWPYNNAPAFGQFFVDNMDPNHWSFMFQSVNGGYDDPTAFSNEMLYIATHNGFDSLGRLATGSLSFFPQPFPGTPSWVNTDPVVETQVPIAVTFQIWNGPLMEGKNLTDKFGNHPTTWPISGGATIQRPWPQGQLVYNKKYGPKAKTAKQVLSDTVQTHANPITDQSNTTERQDPTSPFIGQVQRVRQAGGDGCELPVTWNQRDGQQKTDPVKPGELKLGSTWDDWTPYWDAFYQTPDSDTAYEYDSPTSGGYIYKYKP